MRNRHAHRAGAPLMTSAPAMISELARTPRGPSRVARQSRAPRENSSYPLRRAGGIVALAAVLIHALLVPFSDSAVLLGEERGDVADASLDCARRSRTR